MKTRNIIITIFVSSLLIICTLFTISLVKTNKHNKIKYQINLTEDDFFREEDTSKELDFRVVTRIDTWSKDLELDGITESYNAYTFDFYIKNNSKKDEIKSFTFKITFSDTAFLNSGWNGSLEIHQFRDETEIVDTIPDLRTYNPEAHELENLVISDGKFVVMRKGDYLIYHPSKSSVAVEMPIDPKEATVPGIIMYVKDRDSFKQSHIVVDYRENRSLKVVPLFWVSIVGLIIWFVSLGVILILLYQAKKYRLRHERDNEIINESIETFTGFIDAKDPYTNGHSKRVAIYTKLIAEKMGYEGEELDRIYYIALLHDCGKIGVPDNILGKPGRLTDEEFEIIKSHTVRGGEILSAFKSLENAGEGALYHHERYDGRGYPEGLSGENIPLIARIICVADSFDAMNSNRVYRKKLTKEYIINELETNKGTQFDPKIAEIMLELIREKKVKMDDNL